MKPQQNILKVILVSLTKDQAKKECIMLPGDGVVNRLAVKQCFVDFNLN